MNSRVVKSVASGSVATIVLLVIWEVAARLSGIQPIMLPLPNAILSELAKEWQWYMGHMGYTLATTLAGFVLSVIGGVLIGTAVVSSRNCERFIYPLIVALNSVPKVAVAPLFVIWMGTGSEPKIAIAFLIAVFAIIVDTIHGMHSVHDDIMDLSRALKGRPIAVFMKIRLPGALPSILAGMKVAISLALVGAIVGEFVSSQRGLGYVIMSAQGTFDTVRVFAALFLLALIGMVLYAALVWLERRLTPWRKQPNE
jgi:NitT/TauT family transport system permease protein